MADTYRNKQFADVDAGHYINAGAAEGLMLNMALGTANVLEQSIAIAISLRMTFDPRFRRHPGFALAGASPESPTAILQRLSH